LLPEPTRYCVVVLTSWGRTYRNLPGQTASDVSGLCLDLSAGLRYHFRNPGDARPGAGKHILLSLFHQTQLPKGDLPKWK